jgi:hypothetical protein
VNVAQFAVAALFGVALAGLSFAVEVLPEPAGLRPAVYESTETTETTPTSALATRNSAPEAPGEAKTAPPAVTVPPTCETFVGLAWSLGWPQEELDTLAIVMRRESACDPNAIGDLAVGGSFGLMQVHVPTWCHGSKYWPGGYLAAHGSVGPHECERLFDPATNLAAALLIHREGGWSQWTTWRP